MSESAASVTSQRSSNNSAGESPSGKEMMSQLRNRILSEKSFYIKVLIDSDIILCERQVLQRYSNYFRRPEIARQDIITIKSKYLKFNIFGAIYRWMYVRNETIEGISLVRLYLAAAYLEIDSLSIYCWDYIRNVEKFTEARAFLMYLEGKKCQFRTVKELMVPKITKYFLLLVSSRDFLQLPLNEVITFLTSSTIAVSTERDVLFSAIRWLNYDWVKRRQYFLAIMECIRFTLFKSHEIVPFCNDFVDIEENIVIQEIITNETVQAIIKNSLVYILKSASDPLLLIDKQYRDAFLKELNLKYENPRLQLIFKLLPHGDCDMNIPTAIDWTYDDFTYYIRAARDNNKAFVNSVYVAPVKI